MYISIIGIGKWNVMNMHHAFQVMLLKLILLFNKIGNINVWEWASNYLFYAGHKSILGDVNIIKKIPA